MLHAVSDSGWRAHRRTGTARTLIAGDAGGFVNGFSAEGIYYAMVSGDLAARSIIEVLAKGGDASAGYRARWRVEIGAELEESIVLRHFLFADKRRIDGLVTAAREAAPIVDALGRWASGRRAIWHLPATRAPAKPSGRHCSWGPSSSETVRGNASRGFSVRSCVSGKGGLCRRVQNRNLAHQNRRGTFGSIG